MLWSDESKYNLFSSDGAKYVRRPKNKREDPQYTVPTVNPIENVWEELDRQVREGNFTNKKNLFSALH